MAETYLHTIYPNLGPQIDEAIGAGYSLQETHDHIAGKINEARRNGYQDDEISQYVGNKVDTRKPRGYNPFLAQTYTAAKALNEGVAAFTKGIAEPGQYISEKLGFGRSEVTDRIVDNIVTTYKANSDYWDQRAKEVGAGFMDELVGEAIGAALPGITDFALDLSRAPIRGAAEARSQGQNEILGAVTATAKRLALGKLFHEFNRLTKPLAAVAMGVTGGVEAAAAGGEPKEIVKSATALALYSITGKGRVGIKEIKDLRSGRPTYEAQIRTVEELEASREKVKQTLRDRDKAEAERKAKELPEEEVTIRDKVRGEVENVPPEVLKDYPELKGAEAKQAWEDALKEAKLINNPSRLSIDERLSGFTQEQVKKAEKEGELLLSHIKEGGADKAKIFFRSTHKADFSERAAAGIFFANDFGTAKHYAGDLFKTEASRMQIAELDIKKPYYATKDEIEFHFSRREKWVKELKSEGYDSIVEVESKNPNDMGYDAIPTEVAVFDKSQIRELGVVTNKEGRHLSDVELYNRIKQALSEGKPVPSEILAEYPDLQSAATQAIPPTAQHLELMPEDYPKIRSVAVKEGDQVFEAKPGETTHIQVALSNGLDFERSKSGFVTTEGKFVEKAGKPDPYERVAMEEMRGAEAVKPEVKAVAEDVGAAKARKETKLYGTLLDQQKQAEAQLDKLSNLATTDPARMMEKGNIEALMEYAVRVDRDVFERKMKKFGKFGPQDIWEQEGYASAGDFWDKNAAVSPELTKQVFDRNWSKVGTLAEDIDVRINKMIDTAEKMARAAFESGDRLGMKREHDKMAELQQNRVAIQREHARVKREVGSIVKRITRLSQLRSMDPDYRDHIQSILGDYDLHVRGKKVVEEREGTREFVARQEAAGERVYVPEEKLAMLRKRPLNDISLDELHNLDDVVKSIAHQGVLKRKLLSMKKEKDFQKVKQGLLDSVRDNAYKYVEPGDKEAKFPSERDPKSAWLRFRRKVGEIAGATKVEYIFDKLDGFKGKMYEIKGKWGEVFDMRVRTENHELLLKEADVKTITAAIDPIKKDFPRMMSESFEVDGRTLTRMEAVEIYWNSKNEGNRNALRKGFAMEDATIDRIVGTLSPKEVKFADDIMRLIQDKGPDIAKTLRKLTGEKMKMEKGYFPLWFDWELSTNAAERQQGQDLLKQVYSKIGVERGFTVSRVGGAEAPYLSFDVVIKHLDRVNHFIANAQAVRDFQRIIFDRDIRRSIESNAGEGAYKEVVDWMKEWGNPRQSYMGNLDKWMGILRHNSTLAVLGLKVSTSILQPTAYAQLINRIGFRNSMSGLADFYRNPRANMNVVFELSPFMKSRSHTFDRDLKDFLDKDDYFSKWGNLKNHAMVMVGAMDLATTLPAWWSAYHLGMKKWGWDQAKSVEYADMIVRRTQASGMPKDMPGVLRGSNFKKIFTMFYTYFSSTYNEAARDVRAFQAGEEGALDVARSFFWLFAVQAAIQVAIRKREDASLKEFGNELISTVTGTVPYIGPIVNAIVAGYDYQPSPVFEIPSEVVAAFKAKDIGPKVRHIVMAGGYATGFPSRQAILTAQYLWDVLEGKDYNPANLIYRKRKEKKGSWK